MEVRYSRLHSLTHTLVSNDEVTESGLGLNEALTSSRLLTLQTVTETFSKPISQTAVRIWTKRRLGLVLSASRPTDGPDDHC